MKLRNGLKKIEILNDSAENMNVHLTFHRFAKNPPHAAMAALTFCSFQEFQGCHYDDHRNIQDTCISLNVKSLPPFSDRML